MADLTKGPVAITINKRALKALTEDRNGPVVLHISNIGRSVLPEVRRLTPRDGFHGSGRRKARKHLFQTWQMRLVKKGKGWTVEIFSDAEHALPFLLGARAHPISGAPMLKFYWQKKRGGPGWVNFKSVMHPGNKGNNILEQALRNKGLTGNKLSRPTKGGGR